MTPTEYQLTYGEAEEQAQWLTINSIGGGVSVGPYDDWQKNAQYKRPDESGAEVPKDCKGAWLVDLHVSTGVSCEAVRQKREKYGDEQAAKQLSDEHNPKT